MAEPFQVGPNGEIGIWTGSGYDYSAPASFDDSALTKSWRGGHMGANLYDSYDAAWADRYSGPEGGFVGDPSVEYGLNSGPGWGARNKNYNLMYDGGDQLTLRMKSGDKEGTLIPYARDPATGKWTMQGDKITGQGWDTNTSKRSWWALMPLVAGLGGYALASAAGVAGGAAGGAGAIGGAAPGEAAGAFTGSFGSSAAPAAGGAWGITDPAFSAWNAMPAAGAAPSAASWGGMTAPADWGAAAAPSAAGTVGSGSGTVGSAASQMPSWMNYGSKAAGILGALGGSGSGESGSGGLLGGMLGAGLGYLDAANQPDSLTIKNEIDPRLANLWYGADGTSGIAGQASNLLQQQLGQPNPLVDAGKQISGMANTLPSYNDAVTNNKSLWDSNPWVQDQQNAITNLLTKNMKENVWSDLGTGANFASGYGGSKHGIAIGKSINDLNTQIAPALTNMASSAYENSQNRALQGAGTQLNYGLNNQAQQAGLLGTGASMQANGPWSPFNNMANLVRSAPGNTSMTQPLFNNPIGNAIGMGSLGSQIGSNVNWGDLFKNIGGLFGGGNTPPPQQNLANYNPYNWG